MDANQLEQLQRDLIYVTEQMRLANATIRAHDRALFGDREQPDDYPGMVSEWREAKHAAQAAEKTTSGNRKLHYAILCAVAPPFIEYLFHAVKFITH